jgi:hypothetical protein
MNGTGQALHPASTRPQGTTPRRGDVLHDKEPDSRPRSPQSPCTAHTPYASPAPGTDPHVSVFPLVSSKIRRAAQSHPGDRSADAHHRVRRDRIDASGVITLRRHGQLRHIGVGRTHARTHVIMLIQDLNIRVINAATGELLRELTLNPGKDYQPTGRPPGPPPGTPRPSRQRKNPEP